MLVPCRLSLALAVPPPCRTSVNCHLCGLVRRCHAVRPVNPRLTLAHNPESNMRREVADHAVLMVKGLSETTGEGAILDAFRPFGAVKEIRLVKDRNTKKSRGFGFVEFERIDHARAVLDMRDPITIEGSVARITIARDVKTAAGGLAREGNEAMRDHAPPAHEGPKRSGFGIPKGFLPDPSTGYYYSAETGYYYDATTKLYYHSATSLWYEADPVTGHMKEYTSAEQREAQEAAAHAAAVAEAEAHRAARMAAAKEASGGARSTSEAAAPAPVALEGNHSKVVLGLAKGKRGAAKVVQPVGVFKQAVEEVEEDPDAGMAEEERALVDWKGLICTLCKRRLKDLPTLTKHVEASELHQSNLAAWQAQWRAANKRRA